MQGLICPMGFPLRAISGVLWHTRRFSGSWVRNFRLVYSDGNNRLSEDSKSIQASLHHPIFLDDLVKSGGVYESLIGGAKGADRGSKKELFLVSFGNDIVRLSVHRNLLLRDIQKKL